MQLQTILHSKSIIDIHLTDRQNEEIWSKDPVRHLPPRARQALVASFLYPQGTWRHVRCYVENK
jgi:hypothetical protein